MTERNTTSPVTYTALKGGGAAALYGVSGITLEGTLEVQANLATDKANPSRAPPAIDFTQLNGGGLSVPTGPSSSVLLDFSGGVVKASGSVTLALGGFAYVTGKFAFQQGTTGTPITLSNGHTGTASVTTVGVSDAYAFFGTGGPYWDSNGDGVVSPGETPSAGAMGLAIGNVSLALALVKADAGQFTTDGFTSGFALEASGSVSLVGISAITASIQSVQVSLNQATSTSGAAVDWKASFGGTGLSVDTGGGNSTLLAETGTIFQASGSVTIAIGGFVYLQGNVAFTKGTQKTVTLVGGGTDTVDVLTIGASDVTAFVGVNGPAASTGAIGLSLTGVNFALALMKPTALGSTRSYYALKASVASAGIVGVDGLSISVSSLDLQVNGSSDSAASGPVPVVDFVATYGSGGLAVDAGGGNTIGIDFNQRYIRAAGIVTLGVGGVSVTAGIAVEKSTRTDGTSVTAIGVDAVSVTLGSYTFADPGSSGLFVMTSQGFAGEVTLHGVGFSVGDSTNGASFTTDLNVLFSTATQAVDESLTLADGTVATLSAPAGPYFRLSATNTAFAFAVAGVSYSLTGDFQLEQITVNGEKVIRIGAANVHSSFTITGVGSVSLTGGQGGLIIFSDGVAGTLSGQFDVTGGSLPVQAGAKVTLEINTTTSRNVNETITVAGQPILVNVVANSWKLGFTNLSVSFGDFVSLSGNFTTGSGANGSTVYGATNVEVFFGDGPYRLADGSVNPDAIGLVITGGTLGAVKYADGTYAISASGTASFVGIPGITVTGTLTVKINHTGHAVTDTIQLPSGATPSSVTMPFTTGTYLTEVDGTGITISAAGILTLSGDVKFLLQPDGRVDVSIPAATVGVTIPGVSGPAVSVTGNALFSFGGGLGFDLQRLTVSGFSILGHGITLPPPIVVIPPTATLVSPYSNQVVDVATLNAHHYVDVRLTDQSGAGLDLATILGTGAELTFSGTAASGVVLSGTPTQLDPTNDPGLFRYTFTGDFTAPTSGYSTVGFRFLGGGFADKNRTANVASSGQFYVYASGTSNPSAPIVPSVRLASPFSGATIGAQTLQTRPYIELSFNPGVSGGVVSLDPSFQVTLSGAGAAHLVKTISVSSCTTLASSKTTYRCALTAATGYTPATMFAAGEIDVAIAANTWHVTAPSAVDSDRGRRHHERVHRLDDRPERRRGDDADRARAADPSGPEGRARRHLVRQERHPHADGRDLRRQRDALAGSHVDHVQREPHERRREVRRPGRPAEGAPVDQRPVRTARRLQRAGQVLARRRRSLDAPPGRLRPDRVADPRHLRPGLQGGRPRRRAAEARRGRRRRQPHVPAPRRQRRRALLDHEPDRLHPRHGRLHGDDAGADRLRQRLPARQRRPDPHQGGRDQLRLDPPVQGHPDRRPELRRHLQPRRRRQLPRRARRLGRPDPRLRRRPVPAGQADLGLDHRRAGREHRRRDGDVHVRLERPLPGVQVQRRPADDHRWAARS